MSSETSFRRRVIAKLVALGIKEPEHTIKTGGVGEMLDCVVKRFFRSARRAGACPATISVIGGLAAQETIKAITRKYLPAQQFLMFESLSSIPEAAIDQDEDEGVVDDDQIARVYGSKLAKKLNNLRIFIVGAGAIGSELLKSFALLGIGEKSSNGEESQAKLVLTDMDHIERSNLNRQLLFREKDVGKSKSMVAAEAVKLINPHINILPYSHAVGASSESIFNAEFWDQVDIVATALDNIDARKYIDAQAVMRSKWLVDSGTLGTKGNTQIVIPHVTESYSSTSDPPESEIPLCTIKSFPYKAEHCVAWAKSLFDQLYNADMAMLRDLVKASSDFQIYSKQLDALSSDDRGRVLQLASSFPLTLESALAWSLRLFEEHYISAVKKLLDDHPENSKEEDLDDLFWSGSRRMPSALIRFDPLIDDHRSFVMYAAAILLRCYGISADIQAIDGLLSSMSPSALYGLSSSHTSTAASTAEGKELLSKLQAISHDLLQETSFEKDDPSLGHVAFVAAASNLRCQVYGIPRLAGGKLGVQQLAGKIIPALSTTTAIVGGLVCHEIIKIAGEQLLFEESQLLDRGTSAADHRVTPAADPKLKKERSIKNLFPFRSLSLWKRSRASTRHQPSAAPAIKVGQADLSMSDFLRKHKDRILARFRNSFINVAQPMLSFVEPVPANSFNVLEESFTAWDVLDYAIPSDKDWQSITLQELLDFLSERFGADLRMQSLSADDLLLYADFMETEAEAMEKMTILELLEQAIDNEDEAQSFCDRLQDRGFMDLEVVAAVGEESDPLQLPSIRLPIANKDDSNSMNDEDS
jgi:molybdopterin/thiamine biosynthesis adenylyltransferase